MHIIVFRTLGVLLGFFAICNSSHLMAQLSPGELTEAHAHLEGMSHCTDCHTLGARVSNEKCLDCHVEIRTRMENQQGYHSSAQIRDKECASCHNEHHGRNFRIINFETGSFDHDLTGFELLGAHKEEKCESCHKKEFITDDKIRSKDFSFLGLGTTCLSCHEDYHQESLSSECTKCHGMDSFKPAPLFDHSRTEFPLAGKHKELGCEKCHKIEFTGEKKYQQFAGIAFGNCTACHTDVHQGRFGQNCRECHTEETFKSVSSLPGFDHNRTDFPLAGKHVAVNCRECHKTTLTEPLAHNRCSDCHVDYHRGEFAKDGTSPDCSSCHSTNGFTGAVYSIQRHNEESPFKLEGAHMATPCFVCHKKEERWAFREIGLRCADCHQDIHQDIIDRKYYPGGDCKVCHDVNRWNEVEFDHARTNFQITGAHAKASCRQCHFKDDGTLPARQQFKGLSTSCAGCHADAHMGQFRQEGQTLCESCHNTQAWKVPGFDHNKTRFPLDGKHAGVSCNKCHKPVTEGEVTYVQYKFDDIRCEACHL